MRVEVEPTASAAAAYAARLIAEGLRAALARRGRATLALSRDESGVLGAALAREALAWAEVDLFQVDERCVPRTDPRRNLARVEELAAQVGVEPARVHALPTEPGADGSALRGYALELLRCAGVPPVLDVVHLGLGADGHTASLVPRSEALASAAEVAWAGAYEGVERVTLTRPVLRAARRQVWLVTGASKCRVLARFIAGERALVAARVVNERALVVADAAAASAAADADAGSTS